MFHAEPPAIRNEQVVGSNPTSGSIYKGDSLVGLVVILLLGWRNGDKWRLSMPKRPSFKPLLTAKGWVVSIPESMTGTGKRRRTYFEREKDAKAFGAKLRTDYHAGLRGGTVTPELAKMAIEAKKLLDPLGLTIMDAAKAAVERSKAAESNETFEERWEAMVKQGEGHWRGRYADDMGKIPRWVGKSFMQMRVADITDEIVVCALKAHGAAAASTLKARKARVSPILTGRTNKKRGKRVAILDRRQRALLKWRSRKDPQVRRVVGLLLFAGIRPGAEDGEISRLDWSADLGGELYIDHDVSKTGTDRHIPILRRLCWWIRGHPEAGPVAPAGWKVKWQKLRKEAGISKEQDITRHSFASAYLVQFGEDRTKEAMGHTKGSDTLFKSYRRSVTEREARLYFGLENR
jgi:hypothetical protein